MRLEKKSTITVKRGVGECHLHMLPSIERQGKLKSVGGRSMTSLNICHLQEEMFVFQSANVLFAQLP